MRTGQWIRRLGIALAVILALAIGAWFAAGRPRPTGVAGPEAERLAQQMALAVHAEAWKNTGAVRFAFGKNRHLWDRRRGYDAVEWGDVRVLVRLRARTGRAWKGGKEVSGSEAEELVRKGYAWWINDSFWLNPVVKMYDAGVTRKLVRGAEGPQLLVEYSSGGLNPGDAYLWIPGAGGEPPVRWRMWTHRPPMRGIAATWENWIPLATGARVSTMHRIGPFSFPMSDVSGARTLQELTGGGPDPFAPLADEPEQKTSCDEILGFETTEVMGG